MISDPALESAARSLPGGRWAIGVSGGADSVALLRLLNDTRADLRLHVAHLDHQTRAGQSAGDAEFVKSLAVALNLPHTIEQRSSLERITPDLPRNISARFRRLRFFLFERIVREHSLSGVVLAHHANDQAETVLLRLLRGTSPAGLVAMSERARIGSLIVARPLLGVRRTTLRSYLDQIRQPWREDASNQSATFQRNRVRRILDERDELTVAMLELSNAARRLRHWARASSPRLAIRFGVGALAELPEILARESARRWLLDRHLSIGELSPQAIARLILMARDAASPAVRQFSGSLLVRRRRGEIFVTGGS